MTNTDLEFTRTFDHPLSEIVYRATEPAEDGSFWLHNTNGAWSFRVTPHAENFQVALDQVTNHPETWNQVSWFTDLPKGYETVAAAPECGTAACLAGTVALQHGARTAGGNRSFAVIAPDWYVAPPTSEGLLGVSTFAMDMLLEVHPGSVLVDDDENIHDPEDDGEADVERLDLLAPLWSSDNELTHLWEMGQFLTNGRLTVPSADVIESAQAKSELIFARFH